MLDRLRRALTRRLERLLGELPPKIAPASEQADVNALRMRGNDFIAAGDLVQAEEWFRKALAQEATDSKSLVCLGYVLKEQERLSEARVTLKRAIDLSNGDPEEHEAHYLLGEISEQQGDLTDAARHFSESLRLKPDFSRACNDLCRIHQRQGGPHAVRETLENCVSLSPATADYRVWLADVCWNQMDFEGVVEHLKVAVELGVRTVLTYITLGTALCRLGRVTEGVQTMALGEAMDPAVAFTTQFELGYYHLNAGDLQRGLQHMEKSISLRPNFLPAHSSVLMALSHAGGRDEGAYRRAAERFADSVKSQINKSLPPRPQQDALAPRSADDKLRVGWVSGDLQKHPVAYFLLDVLQQMDKTSLHLVAYSNNFVNDEVTESLKTQFDEWHLIRHLSDDDAAELVYSHQLDVLVDLGGHTGENRLAVLARRPAPTQVTWLGYWASTGLKEMDYLLADPICVPDDSAQWFSERVYRLPHTRLCMAVPKTSRPIPVSPPPSLKNRYLTFGSFQRVAKITPQVLAVWAKVLDAVPGSRLRIQAKAIGSPSIRDKLSQDMVMAGIDLARVRLLGAVDVESYLEAHNEVDILLDTFPYPGGATTAFALWMGVPTITLAGNTMIARQGVGMLHCAGLTEWIAQTEAEYLDIARRMASNASQLEALRLKLRERAEASPLFDAKRFAKDLQSALFDMSGKVSA